MLRRCYRPLLLLPLLWSCAVKQAARTRAHYEASLLPPGLSGPQPLIRDDFLIDIDTERVRLTKAYFEAHNRTLAAMLPASDDAGAITFDPAIVVVHYTVTPTLAETVEHFTGNRILSTRSISADGQLNVGVQFMVDRDGAIYRFYPENVMSRHTIGLNHTAIGIENIGAADLGADDPLALTHAQLLANERLIRYLAGKYPNLGFMIGHSEYRDLEDPNHPAHHLFQEDIATYRTDKVDPGDYFLRALRLRLAQLPLS